MDTTYLHIGMTLSTLGLSPHGFALGLYPKGLIPMEIFVHPYIPMILPISSQCGTLIVYPTGGRVNSILTIGMNDWQQWPELGPIGDVLSGSDSSHATSVLIIQQHSLKGELDGVDDEFSIM